jgi:hypothetical protein
MFNVTTYQRISYQLIEVIFIDFLSRIRVIISGGKNVVNQKVTESTGKESVRTPPKERFELKKIPASNPNYSGNLPKSQYKQVQKIYRSTYHG